METKPEAMGFMTPIKDPVISTRRTLIGSIIDKRTTTGNTVGTRNVNIIYYDEDSVIVSGLEDNTNLISSYIPGIYKGMKIKISN